MRINRGQEFVIGGYTVGTKTFDALIFGYTVAIGFCMPRARAMGSHPPCASSCSRDFAHWKSPMPVCEPPRSEERPLGARIDEGEDGGVSVA